MQKRKLLSEEILEMQLTNTFQAVKPGRHLMDKIHSRIKLAPPSVVAQRMANPQQLLLIIGSVVSGALLVLTIARALYYLAGRNNESA